MLHRSQQTHIDPTRIRHHLQRHRYQSGRWKQSIYRCGRRQNKSRRNSRQSQNRHRFGRKQLQGFGSRHAELVAGQPHVPIRDSAWSVSALEIGIAHAVQTQVYKRLDITRIKSLRAICAEATVFPDRSSSSMTPHANGISNKW